MDQHHVNISTSVISCGVLELSRLESDVEKVLYAIATYLYHPSRGSPAAFLIWSDLPEESNGNAFYEDLLGRFSGELHKTKNVENPKTSNMICVYTWLIPHEEVKKWYIEQRVKKARKL